LASLWRSRRSSTPADAGDVSYVDLVEAEVLQFLKKQKKAVNKRTIETGVVDGQKFDPKEWTKFAKLNLKQAGGKGAGVWTAVNQSIAGICPNEDNTVDAPVTSVKGDLNGLRATAHSGRLRDWGGG
jgi:hypothetical protein